MRLAVIFSSVILIMSAGCSTLHQVDLDEREQWLADARTNLVNHDATFTTKDGRTADGRIVQLTSDSVWFSNQWTVGPASFSLDEVWTIEQPLNAWPAIGGFFGGALIGGLIGGSVGRNQETELRDPFGSFIEKEVSAWSGAIYGFLIGGAGGSAIVGVATSATDYQFHRSVRHTPPNAARGTSPDSVRTSR